MASSAFASFTAALASVDEVMNAAPGPGRPRLGHTGAVVKGGLVHLTAALEGYVEAVFEEATRALWPAWPSNQYKSFFKSTVGRFNNAHEFNTNRLFFNLGMAWIVQQISWQHFPNASVVKLLEDTYRDRGAISHGSAVAKLTLPRLRVRRDLIERYARELDHQIAIEVAARTGNPAPW
jgi:hypothetical protein